MHFAFNDGRHRVDRHTLNVVTTLSRLCHDFVTTFSRPSADAAVAGQTGTINLPCWLRVSSKARPSDANEIIAVPYRLRLRDKHGSFPNPTSKTFRCYSNPKAGLGRRGTSIHSMKHASFSFIVFCFHSQKSNDNR